ncbi:MAG: diguanylate cyclase [Sulfurimonas sp. RIFCSPLOWO2_12_FULL_36_74]|uniref:sensor domain-containing protein n=1 Tax=Sulfurimonas sp. RIFCSPLOWO2_12_36_12 TaxID=1802253 RepID=UPI0008BB5790|nr:GGDEF and EAL domain-containing protein [Sulfurimonas sp. RIFCSPLOWO2_12_36_12]OHD96952.1 MAG: diguanylate cyclase [Sulfurimonas sp. RIFCSPLOWO2_02_FULL_36_28]OHE03058.1 MAG: diguanylate cyclase [Sulfurimonas sp. RIFCSPLOWO2_12_36_12]OHE06579.1 MAG: diguanylate cyclase [Sulfurimonas sp. RIFCSPLOWO2_12_FULL_36_74]
MQVPFDNNVILDSLEQSIFVKDVNSVFLFVNRACAQLIGKKASEIVGKNDLDFFPREIALKYRDDDATVVHDKKVIDTEENIVINNQIRIIRTIKKPLYKGSEVVAIIGIFWDITNEKEEKIYYKKLQSGLKQAQALANIGHWELDLLKNTLYWSDEVYRIFGLKPQEFGATYEAFLGHIHPEDVALVNNAYATSIKEKHGYYVEHRIVRKNGEVGFVEERCEHEFDGNGNPVRSIGTVHDITRRKNAENQLILASAVFEKMNDGVLITDEKQHILTINSAYSAISGYMPEDVKGKTPNTFSSGWHDNIFYKGLWDELNAKGQWNGEIMDRRKSGELYTAELNIIALHNKDGKLTNYISIFNDISEKKQKENLIHNLAYFDTLTNLPNRVLFQERVINMIPALKRNSKKMAIFFIDMDNFKNINDTFGHLTGDKFLIEVAKSIKSLLREQDTLARLGGDEFTIILEDVESILDIGFVADKIISRFKAPVVIEGKNFYTGASVGISIYPDDSESYEGLVKAADTAMYQVKEAGKNGYQFFTQSMNEKITQRALIENDLRSAIDKEELFLEYQPKVNLETKSVYGMEALVRWNHSDVGLIRPDKFIGISEETGQIVQIGLWVAKQAIGDTKALHDEGKKLTVSINVSSKQLNNDSFVDDICAIADDIGLDKSYIELEITESHIMKSVDKALSILNALYAKGFKLSIDDFGTGYSSLSYLKKLPAKTIKIDRSFVLDIDKDEDDRSIVAAIIAMAKSLGKDVIAEGSETKEHVDALKFLHCNQIQGYYFSKPLRIEKFKEFIENFKGEGKSV